MSGHSKWNNIKHKKEKTDAQKAKIFTKIGKEMVIAIKAGGPDPASNSKLRDLIAKAKANNVPNDNIERTIKKAAGQTDVDYEEIRYEGYGPCGVAVIVNTTTDNRNRTASEVRHYFDKFGGNLGTLGCVGYLFEEKGVIIIEKEDVDEDKLMEDAIECGAIDFITDDEDIFEIRTDANDLGAVTAALQEKGYSFVSSETAYIPQTYTRIEDQDNMKGMSKMLDLFDDNDDIQGVWHNWENEDEYEG